MAEEVPLSGGNVSAGVVRVGDTVRRPAGPWSPAVHALLGYLHGVGFTRVPRPLGIDERGREVLSFVPGEPVFPVGTAAYGTDRGLGEIGALVRELHDALAGFRPPPNAHWQVAIADVGAELVVHHDLAPWNMVHSPRHGWGLIDWDGAGPGTREWELAYVAGGFVPLSGDPALPVGEQGRRLGRLADAYRLDEPGRRRLLALLARRPMAMYELLAVSGGRDGVQPWSRLWRAGHGTFWLASAEHVKAHFTTWHRALLC